MEKSQERFSYVRDGQEKLHMKGLDPITIYLNSEKGQDLAAPQFGLTKEEMGLAKMMAAANGPHSHETFRKKKSE